MHQRTVQRIVVVLLFVSTAILFCHDGQFSPQGRRCKHAGIFDCHDVDQLLQATSFDFATLSGHNILKVTASSGSAVFKPVCRQLEMEKIGSKVPAWHIFNGHEVQTQAWLEEYAYELSALLGMHNVPCVRSKRFYIDEVGKSARHVFKRACFFLDGEREFVIGSLTAMIPDLSERGVSLPLCLTLCLCRHTELPSFVLQFFPDHAIAAFSNSLSGLDTLKGCVMVDILSDISNVLALDVLLDNTDRRFAPPGTEAAAGFHRGKMINHFSGAGRFLGLDFDSGLRDCIGCHSSALLQTPGSMTYWNERGTTGKQIEWCKMSRVVYEILSNPARFGQQLRLLSEKLAKGESLLGFLLRHNPKVNGNWSVGFGRAVSNKIRTTTLPVTHAGPPQQMRWLEESVQESAQLLVEHMSQCSGRNGEAQTLYTDCSNRYGPCVLGSYYLSAKSKSKSKSR
jgi:hypothetical protein